jgi:hypothetical protein
VQADAGVAVLVVVVVEERFAEDAGVGDGTEAGRECWGSLKFAFGDQRMSRFAISESRGWRADVPSGSG